MTNKITRSHSILIFYEMHVSGGTDTFIRTLVNHWPVEQDQFTLLCNMDHTGLDLLRTTFTRSISVNTHNFGWCQRFSKKLLKLFDDRAIRRLIVVLLIALRYLNFWVLVIRLSCYFRTLSHDRLIVVNGGYPGADSCRAASIAWAWAGKKTRGIHNFHGPAIPAPKYSRWIEHRIDQCVQNSSLALVTVSGACLQSLGIRSAFRASHKHLFIHNGIEQPAITSTAQRDLFRQSIGVLPEQKMFAMLAHLEKRKGHEFFFAAFQLVREKLPDSCAVCCGSGDEAELQRVRNEIKRLNLGDSVLLMPFQPNPMVVIAAADIVIVPSQYEESFGLVVVEAMATKTPVVATRVGGIIEILTDGSGGFLCNPDDHVMFASQIIRLATEPQLAFDCTESGFERYQAMFTAEKMTGEYANLLK